MVNKVTVYSPKRLVFGEGALAQMADDYLIEGYKKLLIITIPVIDGMLNEFKETLKSKGVDIKTVLFDSGEPTFADYENIQSEARKFGADSVAGIGGGSVLDVAKIVAALVMSDVQVKDVVGINVLDKKGAYLMCMPTTSGTGSEVSPNSILMDENDYSKKGIISPYLVPDGAYVDPVITQGMPRNITANTGIDALTHCIEAFVNKFSHPLVDAYAKEGIRLICKSLKKACENGNDIYARFDVALGSLFGGMCLGPVNTAAVHALAYPLGSMFKMPHGLSNAVLLPYVIEYNLEFALEKYAELALIIGAKEGKDLKETAENGVAVIRKIMKDCGIPEKLSDLSVPENAINKMAEGAIQVQRLLKNNVRELSIEDIIEIYKSAY